VKKKKKNKKRFSFSKKKNGISKVKKKKKRKEKLLKLQGDLAHFSFPKILPIYHERLLKGGIFSGLSVTASFEP